jgi:membrane protein
MVWIGKLLKETMVNFMADKALSHGAAIAYYTVFAIAPLLVIVIAVAGLFFGERAAQGAIASQLSDLMGDAGARGIEALIRSAGNRGAGLAATAVGFGTLILAASSVFVEMQSALNAIWKTKARHPSLRAFVRARAVSFGLVVTVGFLLLVSLAVSTAISALDKYLNHFFPGAHLFFQGVNFIISFILISMLFAAVYKVLPDKRIAWGDVLIGAVTTSFLFTAGKSLIGLYIGSSAVTRAYGAAGGLIIVLLWVYYSAQIFLLGAEFTKAYAERHGSHAPGALQPKN